MEAIGDYDQAARIDPTFTASYFGRGFANSAIGNFDKAIADFNEVARRDPTAKVFAYRGYARWYNGDTSGAQADLNRALSRSSELDQTTVTSIKEGLAELTNKDAAVANQLACAAVDQNELRQENDWNLTNVIRKCSIAIAMGKGKLNDRDLAVAYFKRASAKITIRYLDGSISDFDQAARLNALDAQIFVGRGIARQLKGDIDAAITDWDQAIRIDARLVDAYVLRGIALESKGFSGPAKRDFDEAIALDPKNVMAHYNRGLVLEISGDKVDARDDYQAALNGKQKNREDFQAKKMAANLLAALPDKADAIKKIVEGGSRSDLTVALKPVAGIFVLPIEINGVITLNFVVDSGAADVSIPADVVGTLIRTGTLKSSDFIGNKTYILADGSESPSSTFNIRSLKVGDFIVQGVQGSIAPATGPLLLGQSFLTRFKSYTIDNGGQELHLQP